MSRSVNRRRSVVPAALLALLLALVLPGLAVAHDPPYSGSADRDGCTFTPFTANPWWPLWPGYSLLLEGEEEDEGETVELVVEINVLADTELVDGVETRVVEEREFEDGEIVEVSRNFFAGCRETGAVWYFGEDVDNYEDGEIANHDGAWRAGEDGAQAGVFMPGTPLNGARFFTEIAPGVAEDRAEIVDTDADITVPFAAFEGALHILDTNALEPSEEGDPKYYAPGVGLVKDEALELVEVEPPPCTPDEHTLCLADGRFRVQVEWTDHQLDEGTAFAHQIADDAGEFWFFRADNVELLVKVLDACPTEQFDHFWVFAAGLTDVELTITVTDTETDDVRTYPNPLGNPFAPVLDTTAFECEP
jgi:hypothetical protein